MNGNGRITVPAIAAGVEPEAGMRVYETICIGGYGADGVSAMLGVPDFSGQNRSSEKAECGTCAQHQ